MSYVDDLALRARLKDPKAPKTDEYYLALEKEVETFLKSKASRKDKAKVRGGYWDLELLDKICSGIRFERARCCILDAIDKGTHVKRRKPDRMIEQMKEEGILTEDEQLTDGGRVHLEKYKDKPIIG